MVNWNVILSKQALKDAQRIKSAGLGLKVQRLIQLLENNPYTTPPPYEKLVGNLQGMYSRRITLQHRLVYTVEEHEHAVHVLRLWTHYE